MAESMKLVSISCENSEGMWFQCSMIQRSFQKPLIFSFSSCDVECSGVVSCHSGKVTTVALSVVTVKKSHGDIDR